LCIRRSDARSFADRVCAKQLRPQPRAWAGTILFLAAKKDGYQDLIVVCPRLLLRAAIGTIVG
jgi:hypothetical protein